jgi:hypothetical protein
MLQRLKTLMRQSMLLGLVRNATRSMDKDNLIHYLYLIAICLAAWGGYVVGMANG